MRQRLFLGFLAFFLVNVSNAQPGNSTMNVEIARMQFHAKQVIPPSPEAAALGQYGNVPVSLFTGTPNISVPLVELKGNRLSLPVTLSYNSSGFKPEDLATWTGLGWSLNAGGVVTRSAQGNADISGSYFTSGPSPLLTPLPSNEVDKQTYFGEIRDKLKETEPDMYYYNFMGKSGKFLIQPNGNIFKKEKNLIEIITSGTLNNDFIITIVDDDGMRYEFMELEKTKIIPTDDQDGPTMQGMQDFTSAWYLTRAVTADGTEELLFEYYTSEHYHVTNSNPLSNKSVAYFVTNDGSLYWETSTQDSDPTYIQPPNIQIKRKYLKEAKLKRNGVLVGSVVFESEVNQRQDLGTQNFNGERLLKRIKLYENGSGSPVLVKHMELGYGYFGANQSATQGHKRLKLKTVQEISLNSTAPNKPPYDISYKDENATMPPRYTSSLDHWGYFNNQTNIFAGSPSLIPNVPVDASQTHYSLQVFQNPRGEGANREPNEAAASMTMIEKIVYPTGGFTTFTFEEHEGKIWNTSGGYTTTGGLRIQEITDYFSTNQKATVRSFEYLKNGNPSGLFKANPTYETYSTFINYSGCNTLVDTRYTMTISANSVFGLGSVQGSHVGYEQVTEYQKDLVSGTPLGKTVYEYEIISFQEVDDDLGNGNLKSQKIYGPANKLLQETVNSYQPVLGNYILHRKLKPRQEQDSRKAVCNTTTGHAYFDPVTCGSSQAGCLPGTPAAIHTQYFNDDHFINEQQSLLMEQTVKQYDEISNNYLTTTKEFTYNNPLHSYPTLIEETNSTGDKIFSSVKYVADYTNGCGGFPSPGTISSNILEMFFVNMKSLPVEKLQYREDNNGNNRRYINGQLTNYRLGNPVNIYFLQAQPLVTSVTASSICGSNFTMNSNYRLAATMSYTSDFNLQEESKTNDIVTSYFWGYNKRYPVAKVVGKTHAQALGSGILQTVLDNPGSEIALQTELNKLRSLANAFVTTYTYKPQIGVSSATDPRGRKTFYEYDGLNRLILVRDHDNKILKKICYNYHGQTENCTSVDPCTGQPTTADWQNTGTATCILENGNNTGYQSQPQVDMNPCSSTYGNPRTISVYNPTACPPPSNCNSGNCTGVDKKCVNGVCETGVLKIISTRRVRMFGDPDENGNIPVWWQYYCTSAYCFSDGTTSGANEYPTLGFCTVEICQ